jgi:hypothetical protein
LECRDAPSATPWEYESFDQLKLGTIPATWQQWSSSGVNSFGTSVIHSASGAQSLATSGASNLTARAWDAEVLPADYAASDLVYLNSLQPIQLFVRGQNLSSKAPTYYALSINRGLQAQIVKVVDGVTTVLASVQSSTYMSGSWVQVTLTPHGSQLAAQIFRTDTNQYLNSAGKWQSAATSVMDATDSAIAGNGFVGLARPAQYADTVSIDDFRIIAPPTQENFDTTPANQLPLTWLQWSNSSSAAFVASNAVSQSPSQSLQSSTSASTAEARAWLDTPLPQNIQATASFAVNSLIPLQIFARGSNLNTSAPSYYAVSVSRGLVVSLLRVINGSTTVLGTIKSTAYLSNQWVSVSLVATNSRIRAVIYRSDTGQYLNASGNWSNALASAIDVQDSAIVGVGFAGVDRPAAYAGAVNLDDFQVTSANGDIIPPTVAIQSPANGATLSGTVPITATATDDSGIDHVEFWIDGTLRFATSTTPYQWSLDTTGLANGLHDVTVKAYDTSGNIASSSITCTVDNTIPPLPGIPRHYDQIRIAELAYAGTPFTQVEQSLLQNSVDLVVSNPGYLANVNSISPNTPQLIYINASNMYGDLLTSWLNYAETNGIDPETAFYHVTKATPFTGNSGSSQPVNWFWSVLVGSNGSWADKTSKAHASSGSNVAFGGLGQSVAIGYPEEFREIDLKLASLPSKTWSGAIQYVAAVDANGNPTAWKTLNLGADTTKGMTQTGQVTFDPPSDWVPASIDGGARLYYVRVLTTTGGVAPVATSILGADYVNAKGTTSGTIPAFDYSADLNHDGYLNDAEYARRRPGMDARFAYQSRVFYPSYGQMRFAVNPTSAAVQNWFAGFALQFLQANPLADGLFVDNSNAQSPVAGISTVESSASYSQDYAKMLAAASQKIAPDWIMANVAGGGVVTNGVITSTAAAYDESALRPLAENYQQFLDLATTIDQWQATKDPSGYMVIDSLPNGGSPTDPRTQIATLASYYLIADPNNMFLDFYGGYDPNSSWTDHWSQAAAYDIGQPIGSYYITATGADPSNTALTYEVFERQYQNAIVLYKPLSYKIGVGSGTLSDASATTMSLNGTYRILNADGTLSGPLTSISLRNGEGAILVKV